MDNDRRVFLKKLGQAAWVVPAMHVVNMSAAAAGTTGSVVDPGTPASTTKVPVCGNSARGGWTKAEWTGSEWVWSSSWVGSDCFDAAAAIKVDGGALGVAIAGDRQGLIVAIGDQANILGAAFKSTDSNVCGRAVVSPGLKLAAFEPAHGDLVQIELALEFCD